jgi:hypothetical protein
VIVADIRIINVGGTQVGLNGLDLALSELGPSLAVRSDEEAGAELVARLEGGNYIPAAARREYVQALARELRRHLGQPCPEPASPGLEVKILGQGCLRCEGLTSAVMSVLSEMGLPAAVDHLRDIKDIAAYGVMGTPALVVNGQVVCVGQVPSAGQIRQWLERAAGPRQGE